LAEALRYGIGGLSRASNSALVQANLGASVVTVVTSPDAAELGYTIRRSYKQPAALLTSEGRSIESVDLDRGTFLPLDAYNSDEIEAIANETLGQKRRALLDELRDEELRGVLLTISDAHRSLEANADGVKASRRAIRDLTEQIEEIGDARARLAALPPAPGGAASSQFVRLTQEQQASESDVRELGDAINRLDKWKTEVAHMGEEQKRRLPKLTLRDHSANARLMSKAAAAIALLVELADTFYTKLVSKVDEGITALESTRMEIEAVKTQQTADVSRLHQKNLVAGQAIRERTNAEQMVEGLDLLEQRREAENKTLQKLLDQRRVLKADYLLKREKVSNPRETVAADLQQKIGDAVRIRVLRNADNLAYQQLLLQGLRGARVRNHDEILAGLMQLRPEQIAQIIQENDSEEFEELLSLGRERSSKIIEAFRATLDPLAIEIIDIEDRVSIELNVATAGQPHFKDAADLSQGQKCTALLPLLLSRRDTPLLIDQPEDNLDNHFIYETVVDAVRRLRGVRQMIFITHNANIPVLGEADLVVVMNSDGKKGYVEKVGSLDDCRDEIIDLLEGGKKAFEARSQRYGKS
jgi:hypothetical protein